MAAALEKGLLFLEEHPQLVSNAVNLLVNKVQTIDQKNNVVPLVDNLTNHTNTITDSVNAIQSGNATSQHISDLTSSLKALHGILKNNT